MLPGATTAVALEKPSEVECGPWYFQRYVLNSLPYSNKDEAAIGGVDPLLVGRANVVYERGEKEGVPIL